MALLTWLQSLFAWEVYREGAIWRYEENAISKRRRALKVGACSQPLMREWLRDGDMVIDHRGCIVVGSKEWLARW